MKKGTRIIVTTLSVLIFFALFFGISYFLSPNPPREPAEGFASLRDEYISAIETFNSTGELVIPEGARFSYDTEKVTLKDTETNAHLSCTFALDGAVPVYSWDDGSCPSVVYFAILAVSIAASICFYCDVEQKAIKRKFRKLNEIKANSPDGDNRKHSINCTTCCYRNDCSCLTCKFVKECGKCFHSSCQANFENKLANEGNTDTIFETEEE